MKHALKRPEDLVLSVEGGVARLTINRPQIRNAFDDVLIHDLTALLKDLAGRAELRCLVLSGEGKAFSAGADLDWMRRAGAQGEHENFRDAHKLAELMQTLDTMPVTTIARVNGAAMGGGVGLTAACDIAIAGADAIFALSEVKLGIIPAAISPYVIRSIGVRNVRRYFQTGERFDATVAMRLGLVHEVVPDAELDAAVDKIVAELLHRADRHPRRQGPDPHDRGRHGRQRHRRHPAARCRPADRPAARHPGSQGRPERVPGEAEAELGDVTRASVKSLHI